MPVNAVARSMWNGNSSVDHCHHQRKSNPCGRVDGVATKTRHALISRTEVSTLGFSLHFSRHGEIHPRVYVISLTAANPANILFLTTMICLESRLCPIAAVRKIHKVMLALVKETIRVQKIPNSIISCFMKAQSRVGLMPFHCSLL